MHQENYYMVLTRMEGQDAKDFNDLKLFDLADPEEYEGREISRSYEQTMEANAWNFRPKALKENPRKKRRGHHQGSNRRPVGWRTTEALETDGFETITLQVGQIHPP